MRIRIKEDVIKHGDPPFPVKGDEITVDDATGRYFCEAGWATDITPGESPLPDVEPSRNVAHGLHVPTATHGQSADTV